MDLQGFRETQSPWVFTQPPERLVEIQVGRLEAPKKDTAPTPDARFAGWAAPMSDGRVGTDYRPKCEANMPTGTQFATRQFMQRNAEEIMNLSRKRQAQQTGAGLAFDSRTDVPAQSYVRCSPNECRIMPNVSEGVGVERVEGSSPELFGTFAMSRASWMTPAAPSLTHKYEGGRNTPRGVF
jgi:hypothetical protein